jgi:hypothetical protein
MAENVRTDVVAPNGVVHGCDAMLRPTNRIAGVRPP